MDLGFKIQEFMRNTPPTLSRALPLLGHALEFKKDRTKLFQRGLEAHGRVFGIRLGPKKAAVVVGPEHALQFFKETDKSLDMAKPYAFIKAAFGNVSFVADHATYVNQRPMLYAPFTREKMGAYLEVMNVEVQAWLDRLPEEGEMELGHEMNLLVQEIAGHAIMGKAFQERVGREFWDHYFDIGKSLDPLLPPNLPLRKFRRRDRARKALSKILHPILTERRQNPDVYQDFLQDLINTPFADGSTATDDQVLSMVMALLFAGHETTAGQATWTLIQLMQNPGYLSLLQDELDRLLPRGTEIDQKKFVSLRHVRWAVDETTRMKPSADLAIRVADRDIEVGDYVIPKGWAVFLGISAQQMMPELFDDPERYDPLRFGPDRAEHKRNRHCIAGFGGGIHKCAGMNFALNEMAVITALLFQQFDLELLTEDIRAITSMGASRPTEAWVKFKRKPVPVHPQAHADMDISACPYHARLQAEKEGMAVVEA